MVEGLIFLRHLGSPCLEPRQTLAIANRDRQNYCYNAVSKARRQKLLPTAGDVTSVFPGIQILVVAN